MWLYENKKVEKIEDLPENAFGFIYRIYNKSNGKSYIGKKFLHHFIKKKIGGRSKKIQKESDWLKYCGSNKNLISDIKNGDEIEKIILYICSHKKQLTYYEMKFLFLESVLEKENYYNDNISGKFYRKDV